MLYFFAPQASVDGGTPMRVGWGDSFLPAAPGPHRLDIWFDYLFGPAGRTAGMIDVPAEGVARVRYQAPFWWVFSGGTLTVDGAGPAALPPGQPPTQPVGMAQPVAQPAAPPQPQWDAHRGAYVQWDPGQQRWLQFDDASQQWRPLS
jgi:hypothetical protein